MRRRSIVLEHTQREGVIPSAVQEPKADRQELKQCPFCGKALVARGAHFHIRACRG